VLSILTGRSLTAPAIYGSNPNLSRLCGSSRQQQNGERSPVFWSLRRLPIPILLVAAGLMIKSFIRLQQVQPGLDREVS
jgi:hypothetical protein